MGPNVFIPMLEQTGLIHEVGLWVIDQSLKQHKALVKKGFAPLRFSVNLFVAQFRRDDFVDNVLKLLKKHKVEPQYLELEITESLLSKNFADTIEKLTRLNDAGLHIAIDDFGKGYSSLHRLQLVPFNRIKIDKSVVDNITTEGVETKEQAAFMKDLGTDEIQGYYYSRPLPPKDLEDFLKQK